MLNEAFKWMKLGIEMGYSGFWNDLLETGEAE